jgi:hypothetical protein
MKSILEKADILNTKPHFFINSKSHFITHLGIIIGLFTIFSILSLTSYFIIDYYEKNDINVMINNFNNIYPEFNFTRKPFMFSLQTVSGEFISNDIVNFSPQLFTFLPENNGRPNITYIPYEKCSNYFFENFIKNSNGNINANFNSNFNDNISLYNSFENLESYYCLKSDSINITLFGSFGDLSRGYSYLNLYLNRCKNDSFYNHHNITCNSEHMINSTLSGVAIYLRIAYVDLTIDHSDYHSPIKPYIKSDAFQISPSFYPRFFYYFQKFSYFNDVGYFCKELKSLVGYKFEKFSEINSLKNPFVVPEAFSLFSITLTSDEEHFVRSYQKIQNLIANLGGLVKGVVLIGECVLLYFSKKSLFVHYANSIMYYQKESTNKGVFNTKISMNFSNHVNVVNLNKIKNFATTTNNNDSPSMKVQKNQNLNKKQNFNENQNFKFKKIEISQTLKLKKRQEKYIDREINHPKDYQLNLNCSFNDLKNIISSKLKPKKIKMTIIEMICPTGNCFQKCIRNKNRVNFYMRSEKLLREILSMENVLHVLTQYDVLKTILLDEKKLTVFNSLPKLSLEDHEKLLNNRKCNFINSNSNQDKLLECLSSLNKEVSLDNRLINYFAEDL